MQLCSLRAIRGESAFIYTLSVWKTAGMGVVVVVDDFIEVGEVEEVISHFERERGRAGTGRAAADGQTAVNKLLAETSVATPLWCSGGILTWTGDLLSLKQTFFLFAFFLFAFFLGKGGLMYVLLGGAVHPRSVTGGGWRLRRNGMSGGIGGKDDGRTVG